MMKPIGQGIILWLSFFFTAIGGPVPIGGAVPDFPPGLNAPVHLTPLRGKVVILYLYLIEAGCTSCDEDLLHLRRLKRRYRGRVEVIAVSDSAPLHIQAFRKGMHHSIPVVRDPASAYGRAFLGRIKILPYIAVITPTGHLGWVGRGRSLHEVDGEVERILSKQSEKTVGKSSLTQATEPLQALIIYAKADPATGIHLPEAQLSANAIRQAITMREAGQIQQLALTPGTSGNANRVLAALSTMKRRAGKKGGILVTYSGPLTRVNDPSKTPALLLPGHTSAEALPLKTMEATLGQTASRCLLLLDTALPNSSVDRQEIPHLHFKSLNSTMSILLSSAHKDRGERLNHSGPTLFMASVTKALLKRHKNKVTAGTAQELYRSVRDSMSNWSRLNGPLQSPVLFEGRQNTFILPIRVNLP